MSDGDRKLGEIQARVDALADAFRDFRDESRRGHAEVKALVVNLGDNVGRRLNDHSRRLGSLERWRSYIAGGLAVLAAALTLGRWLVSVIWARGTVPPP